MAQPRASDRTSNKETSTMPQYAPPLRDMQFLLHEVFDLSLIHI